jgi:hypothetical protein
LLAAFDTMVDRQLAHPKSQTGWRRNTRRRQLGVNIPRALVGDLAHVVVVYGESTPRTSGAKDSVRSPLYWIAERLGTGERCVLALKSDVRLTSSLLGHLELTESHFADAVSGEEFRAKWSSFLHPADTLVAYHQNTLRLLSQVRGVAPKSLVLKSISLHPARVGGTLEDRLESEGLVSGPPRHPGRAGKRLAQAVALVQHLNALGNAENDTAQSPRS